MRRKPRYILKPSVIPLILMICGSALAAVPAVYLTMTFFDLTNPQELQKSDTVIILTIMLCGFGLLFGYILTLLTRRFSLFLWTFSTLYNLALSAFYLLAFFSSSLVPLHRNPDPNATLGYVLFFGWMFFMTVGSGYYAYRACLHKSLKLP